MDIRIETSMQFPMATFAMQQGEMARISQGSMIYKTNGVELSAKLNSKGSGVGKLLGAVGRSIVSGESMFITEVSCNAPQGEIALAPNVPGTIVQLDVGQTQFRLNDSVFLAMDGSVNYTMEKQSLGKAVFAKQGGLYVMATEGQGRVLLNAFGSIKQINLQNAQGFAIDNGHVVAWDKNLNYDISLQGGIFGSIGTGEGVVNVFNGTGIVYIQTLNLQTFASQLNPFITTSS